jgi:segregation and condensation protein A
MMQQEGHMDVSSIFPNPDNPLEIRLPVFEGPLDLLLHLIRCKEVPVAEVRLAELTSTYLAYLRWMETVDLDIAGEFLDIAATLILIKSRTLLPKPPAEEEAVEEEDPEEVLRRRLEEYQLYKQAAFELGSLDWLGRDVFSRPELVELLSEEQEPDPEFEEVSVFALVEALEQVLARRPKVTRHVIEAESLRIEDRLAELLELFRHRSHVLFEDLFDPEAPKRWWILTFMAVLEMVRLRMITLVQVERFGTIHCRAHEELEHQRLVWLREVASTWEPEAELLLQAS